ncbi:MAG TPA: leucyl aminopeptidase [Nocardioidaceae bacterium]|nr:leucyl aminopeptidase [Nocardioidaceae bacterium]
MLPDVELRAGNLLSAPAAEVLAVGVSREDDELVVGSGGSLLLDRVGVDLFTLLDRADAKGSAGEVVALPVLDGSALQQVLLVGVGAGEPSDMRRAGAALARRARGRDLVATSIADQTDEAGLAAFVEGIVLGSFTFTRRTTRASDAPAGTVVLAETGTPREAALRRGLAMGRAGWLSRVLALTPSNEKSPQWLAEQARDVAASSSHLSETVWDEQALAADGFAGILAVGRGSPRPPRLIRLDYRPRGTRSAAPRFVLVGKGITFDSGGLSLKPSDAMMTMKRDMTGGGVVIAAMAALAELGVEYAVTGLVAAAENSISGSAQRPGDVIAHFGGRTSEVLNTDAEGRLVLADALAYATTLRPEAIVDVATLTGAVKVALGQRMGGLYSDDDALAGALESAGRSAGEPLWRLPLVDDYVNELDSAIADANNAPRGPAGSITAALFLRPFVEGVPWAHLDVASAGDSPVDAYEWTQGATGFGVRALLHWLVDTEQRQTA